MKMLFAGDDQPYSEYAMKEFAKLAVHTWADVTILGVAGFRLPKDRLLSVDSDPGKKLAETVGKFRDVFSAAWDQENNPYESDGWEYQWQPVGDSAWEQTKVRRKGRKEFKVRLRGGSHMAQEILAEARRDGADLIVLGCSKGEGCTWQGSAPVPQDVISNADCSVLVVKEDRPVKKVLACLDEGHVTQESMEMINQMVTIHAAELELVGLGERGSMKTDAFDRLHYLADYYGQRNVPVKTRMVDMPEFEKFIEAKTDQDLLALWMGKKSILSRFFPKEWITRMVGRCKTCALVMR